MDKKKTGVITSPEEMKNHKTGAKHPENPDRILVPFVAIEEAKIPNTEILFSESVSDEVLELCHTKEFIRFLQKRSEGVKDEVEDLYSDDKDMRVSTGSEKAARSAVGAVVKACEQVATGQLKNAFCLVRPPGHHALADKAMGFCFYNNLAVGARYLQENFPQMKKILIIDWDLHHGNGTQSLFEGNEDIFYFSLQLQGIFPGRPEEESFQDKSTLNVNVNSSVTGSDEVALAFSMLEAKMEFFKPDCIMISCGFDGHAEEQIVSGGLGLTDEDYEKLTKRVKEMAEKYCGGKLISVLEGGYNVEVLKRVILAHLQVLAES